MNERHRNGQITHLLYADDTLIFCDAEDSQVKHLMAILICFQAISGLKINFSKSRIFAVGNVQNINEMAHIFGCAVDTFPTSYLGLPLGCKPTLSVIWNPVITSIQSKLDSWKVRHLSFGGRLVLIKHVLGAMPFYFMTLFKAPCRIIKKIEQLQRTFLWSGNSESRKFHGVCWNQTKASRTRGGLGILDLRCMNSALLSKWIWKYASQPSAWWRSLLDTKNGLSTSTWKMSLREGFGSWSVWRRIMTCESDFWKIGFVDPGRGLNTSFWHDSWVRGEVESLKSSYPRVFAASIDKEACIADIFCRDDRSWNLQLNVSLRGGAATELFELRLLLDSLSGDMLARDVEGLHWPLENSSSFTVRSMYSHLATQRFRGLPDFPTNRIWLQIVLGVFYDSLSSQITFLVTGRVLGVLQLRFEPNNIFGHYACSRCFAAQIRGKYHFWSPGLFWCFCSSDSSQITFLVTDPILGVLRLSFDPNNIFGNRACSRCFAAQIRAK
ncbi:Putative ribonuclease H protein At1g65750 [Linum grandiflorum]